MKLLAMFIKQEFNDTYVLSNLLEDEAAKAIIVVFQ